MAAPALKVVLKRVLKVLLLPKNVANAARQQQKGG